MLLCLLIIFMRGNSVIISKQVSMWQDPAEDKNVIVL